MSKKKAGERKRTVTVVVGPITDGLLSALIEDAATRLNGYRMTEAGIVGAGLVMLIGEMLKRNGMPVPDGWRSNCD
jgi:hypothetical protein